MEQGIYLLVQFNFPRPFQPEYGDKARALHQALDGQDWIEEVLAASGGLGAGPAGLWVFRLHNYAGLDQLFGGENEVSKAYLDFFSAMDQVQDMVREAVVFS